MGSSSDSPAAVAGDKGASSPCIHPPLPSKGWKDVNFPQISPQASPGSSPAEAAHVQRWKSQDCPVPGNAGRGRQRCPSGGLQLGTEERDGPTGSTAGSGRGQGSPGRHRPDDPPETQWPGSPQMSCPTYVFSPRHKIPAASAVPRLRPQLAHPPAVCSPQSIAHQQHEPPPASRFVATSRSGT